MSFPFNAFHEIGLDTSLLLAVLIGMGFGFMLERGGFGSSKVLSGVFYLKDWRVLKVMFTAIITAMLGLYAAQGMGWVVMDQVAFRPTFLGGQIVGGLLLGAGFVTAGYCPGTSVVGLVSGKLDAAMVILGILLGIGVFEEWFPAFAAVRDWGSMGRVSLADWMGVPTGAVVLIVVALALGAFALVRWLETGGWTPPRATRARAAVASAVGAAALVALIQFAGPGEAAAIQASIRPMPTVAVTSTTNLAGWMVEGRNDYQLIDLRADSAGVDFPAAWRIPAEELLDLRQRPVLPPGRRMILIDADGQSDARRVAATLTAEGFHASILDGGAAGWQREVLNPNADAAAAQALRMMLTGQSPLLDGSAPPPPPNVKAPPPKRGAKKGGGCS